MTSRTLYISIIVFYALALVIVFGYYWPEKIYQAEIDRIEDKYQYSILLLPLADSLENRTPFDAFDVYQNDPQLSFILMKSDSGEQFLNPNTLLDREELQRFPSREVITLNGDKLVLLRFKLAEERLPGLQSVVFGVCADRVLREYNKSRDLLLLVLVLIIAFTGVAVFLFEKFLRKPLNEVVAYIKDYRNSNMETADEFTPHGLLELQYLALELNALLSRMDSASEENAGETSETDTKKSAEIDPTSSLAQMPLDLKHETSKDLLLEKANELITERYQFHVSMIYLKDGPIYRFHSSHMKGMKILNDRFVQAIKDKFLDEETEQLKKLNPFRPYVTSAPHFSDILNSLNLRGHFVYHPIAADGILIVGYLDEQIHFSEADLKRMTTMANYIILSLIDQESINRLRQQIKIKTNELESANEMLAGSIKNKDMMLKLISHDLNAPLRNVYGLIDSIQRKYAGQLNKDINARLERIRNNINKEITMINDILENFKAVEKSDTLIPINIVEIIKIIQSDLQYELDKNKVKINTLEDYPVIYSDPYVVEHIFLNLIDNACKHFEPNGHDNQINISYSETHEGIAFEVMDNGSGIPVDKLQQIDAYFRGKHEDVPKNTSGVGLGLALTKNLVDRINGQINVKSQPGHGCVFTVVFSKVNIESIPTTNQQGWN